MQTVKTTVKSRSPFVVSPQGYSQTSVGAMLAYLNSLCEGILLESRD